MLSSFQVKNSKSQINFNSHPATKPLPNPNSKSMSTLQSSNHMNHALTNNYETMEYEEHHNLSRNTIPNINSVANIATVEYDANTIDVYCINDSNVIYEDKSKDANLANTQDYYHSNHSTPVKSGNTTTQSPTKSATTSDQYQTSFCEVIKSVNNYETSSRFTPSNTYNQQHIKYLIDINDLKSHLASNYENTQSKSTVQSSLDSEPQQQVQLQRGGASGYYDISSKSNLVKTIPINTEASSNQVNHFHKKVINNKIELNPENFCCCRPCVSIVNMFCQICNLFSKCCMRPCCSALAVLGGLIGIAVLLIGLLAAFYFGIVPVPQQITQSICNNTRENFYYRENFTYYVTPNFTETTTKIAPKLINETLNSKNKTKLLSETTTKEVKTKRPGLASDDVMSHLIRVKMDKVLNRQKSLRHKIIKFIALQYDILLLPSIGEEEKKILHG